ncbi:MAG: hypothetical protein P8171_19305 [Candidatus Thiodiazotropha sp.]
MTDRNNVKPTGGEGDCESARRFNKASREFVRSGKGDQAHDPAGQPAEWTERRGKSRAKELDPEERRDYDRPSGV